MREMPVIADFILVAISLVAPALGGSTFLWTKAVLFLLGSLLIFAHPSRRALPRTLLVIFLLLLALGATAFLPVWLFPEFPWRAQLEKTRETPLPGLLSPQPWLSLEDWLLMAGSIFWTSYLLTRGVTVRRRTLMSAYAGGIVGLALAALFLFFKQIRTDLWHPLNGDFGFFPNRNHTGNVLALGGIIALSLAYDHFMRRKKLAWFWLASFALLGVALVLNKSRAGILLFFLGSAAWFLWVTWKTKEFKRMAVGGSTLMLFLTLFLLFGGRALDRFYTSKTPSEQSLHFRRALHKDTLRMMKDSSWHGLGLGNFEPVFSAYRKDSATTESRALHPESDWLLAGAEIGWFAPLLALGALAYILRKRWPTPREPSFHLRAAATVGVIAFAIHGVIDVPGHRFGALWPALFLLAMTQADEEEFAYRPWLGKLYRAGAFVLCILGLAWVMDSFGSKRLPTSAAVYAAKQDIISAYDNGRHAEVIAAATRGLKVAPLDWYFYYNRGLAEAWILSTPDRAIADLSRAYHLERLSSTLPFFEGRVWLTREPELAVQAWNLALQLTAPAARPGVFSNMLNESAGNVEVRKWLRDLAVKDPDNYLQFLASASNDEFRAELADLRQRDANLSTLTDPQRKKLFDIWRAKGDVAEMAAQLQKNPEWANAGWLPLSESMAARKEFQKAYEIAHKNAAKPILPTVIKSGAPEELMRAVLFEKDFVAGYALYYRYLTENKPEEALKTIRSFVENPNCPLYFHYLAAEREAEIFNWEGAWKSIHVFVLKTMPQ